MPKDIETGTQSKAFKTASMRYKVDPAQLNRMGDRLAELDTAYASEIKRLNTLVKSAKKKLFGK